MPCLDSLAQTLSALLPDCPTGQLCRQVLDVSAGCVTLDHLPTSAPTLLSTCGGTITSDHYLMDYTSGTLYTCVDDGKVLISYRYSLAATYIQQAVRDLGIRIPQRNTICTPLFANCGLAPLPCSVHRIDWIRVSDCTCGQPACHRCAHIPRCACTDDQLYTFGDCGLYQRGDTLVVDPPPCADKMLHICYVGGYPLDKNGCYVGLSAELADLALLKAQAIAYSNPRLLFDLAGVTATTTTLGLAGDATLGLAGTGEEDNTYAETTTVMKTYGTCGKETGSTTTKSGTKNTAPSGHPTGSSNSSGATDLLKSTQWLSLARQFQADYEKAVLLRTESANIGHAPRNGYRTRFTAIH